MTLKTTITYCPVVTADDGHPSPMEEAMSKRTYTKVRLLKSARNSVKRMVADQARQAKNIRSLRWCLAQLRKAK